MSGRYNAPRISISKYGLEILEKEKEEKNSSMAVALAKHQLIYIFGEVA